METRNFEKRIVVGNILKCKNYFYSILSTARGFLFGRTINPDATLIKGVLIECNFGRKVNNRNCKKVTGFSKEEIQEIIGVREYFSQNHMDRYSENDNLNGKFKIFGNYPKVSVFLEIRNVLVLAANIDFEKKIISFEFVKVNNIFNSWSLLEKFLINSISRARKVGFSKIRVQTLLTKNQLKELVASICLARLGFALDNISMVEFKKRLTLSDRKEISLHELIQTKDGIKFWQSSFFGNLVEFDLDSNSWSSKTLDLYLSPGSHKDKSSPCNLFLSKLKSTSLIVLKYSMSSSDLKRIAS